MATELLKISVNNSGQIEISSAFKDLRPNLVLDAMNDYAVQISKQVKKDMSPSEAICIENFLFFLDAAFKANGAMCAEHQGRCLTACIKQTRERYPEIYR